MSPKCSYNTGTLKKAFPKVTSNIIKKKPSVEEAYANRKQQLLARTIETEGFSQQEIICYMWMYVSICIGDRDSNSPISIKNVADFFNNTVYEISPQMWNRMRRLFEFPGTKKYSDAKAKSVIHEMTDFFATMRTVKNVYAYSFQFRESMEKIVKKFTYTSKDLSILEISKWAILWFVFFENAEHFTFDYDKNKTLLSSEGIDEVNKLYVLPETMISTEAFFEQFDEKSISIDKMEEIIESCKDKTVAKFLYHWVQLDGSEESVLLPIGEIRKIKENFYTNLPVDHNKEDFTIEELKAAWLAPLDESDFENPYFVSLIEFVNWWATNPTHKLSDGKDFFQHEMNLIFFGKDRFKVILETLLDEINHESDSVWISEVTFERIERNIISALLDMSDHDVFNCVYQYAEAITISSQELFDALGIPVNDFSFMKNFFSFDLESFSKQISKVKKEKDPSTKDRTLLRIYNYLKHYDPLCGNNKQKFSAYGI